MQGAIDLSVVLVNWHSVDFLQRCLASVYANCADIRLETIVVDNDSRDGCGEMLETYYPTTHFVQNQQNGGFARANNLGVRHSRGRVILFLNPDTEVEGQAIQRLLEFVDRNADAGVVGARLLNSDGTFQESCVQAFPTLLNQVLDADCLHRWFPRLRLWGTRSVNEKPQAVAAVDVVSGACQMIRRDRLDRIGLYSTRYFMYSEDLDLCLKARRAGFVNYYVGTAIVVHHGGQSTRQRAESNFAAVMMRESICRLFERHRGTIIARLYRVAMVGVALLRLTIIAFASVVTLGLVRREVLARGLSKWLAILRWSIGMQGTLNTLSSRTDVVE